MLTYTAMGVVNVLGRYMFDRLLIDRNTKNPDFVDDEGLAILRSKLVKLPDLRMYGNAEELAGLLKQYRGFSTNYKFFDLDYKCPFNYWPNTHYTMGRGFICKHDIFTILAEMIFALPEAQEFVQREILLYLKLWQEKLGDSQEFVLFGQCQTDQMKNALKRLMEKRYQGKTSTSNKTLKIVNFEFGDVLSFLKDIFPFEWNSVLYYPVELHLKERWRVFPYKQNQKMYHDSFEFLQDLFKVLPEFFQSRPQWFLPRTDTEKTVKPMLRRFVDGNHMYLLLDELLRVRDDVEKNPKSNFLSKFRTKYKGYRKTSHYSGQLIDYQEFLDDIGSEIDSIQIIYMPLTRTRHRAVPFLNDIGTPSLLAGDVLIECLLDVIWGTKIFIKESNKIKIFEGLYLFLREIEEFFNPEMSPYYLTQDSIEEITIIEENGLRYLHRYPSKTIQEINKSERFNAQSLRIRLFDLVSIDARLYFLKHADRVFEKVSQEKKEESFRTCDMYDALGQCQLIAIILKFPKIGKFLHKQRACGRVYYPCPDCQKEAKMAKSAKNEEKKQSNCCQKSEKDRQSPKDIEKPKDKSTSTEPYRCEQCSQDSESIRKMRGDVLLEQNKGKMLEKKLAKSEKKLENCVKEDKDARVALNTLNGQLKEKDVQLEMIEERFSTQRNELKELTALRKKLAELNKKHTELDNLASIHRSKYENSVEQGRRASNHLENQITSEDKEIKHREDRLAKLSVCKEATLVWKKLERELEEETVINKKLQEKHMKLRGVDKKDNSSDHTVHQEKTTLVITSPSGCLEKNAQPKPDLRNADPQNDKSGSSNKSQVRALASSRLQRAHTPVGYHPQPVRTTHPGARGGKEIEDKTCLVCRVDVKNIDETSKCLKCFRRYHTHCIDKWLQTNQTCPICKSHFLSETEYPALQ